MRGVRLQRYDAQWMLKVTVHKQMTYTTNSPLFVKEMNFAKYDIN